MISQLTVNNFKSHRSSSVDLKNLTVLCGANGTGKSSIVQAILLTREAYFKDKFKILDLQSNPCKIGFGSDAIFEFGDYDGFEFWFRFDQIHDLKLRYEAKTEDEKANSYIKLNESKSSSFEHFDISEQSIFSYSCQYISANRIGPQQSYGRDGKTVDLNKQISLLDGKCEFFIHYLDRYRSIDVIPSLCLRNNTKLYSDLLSQVTLWENYIFDGANIKIQDMGKLGYTLKYYFDVETNATKKTKDYDAINVGFGLSYTLPIIVAILSCKPGSLVLIENPEAHLHPSGISKLTELLCLAAQSGIQLIVETHSDHIINGILVQAKRFEIDNAFGINKTNTAVYQIERDEVDYSSKIIPIQIEDGGRIYTNPVGFFDQIDKDLRELI